MPRVVKQEGDDPDPTPYLFVSLEQKRIDQTKPYDAKKACWVPDEEHGFLQGEIRGTKGDLVTVALPSGDVSCIQLFVKTFRHNQSIIVDFYYNFVFYLFLMDFQFHIHTILLYLPIDELQTKKNVFLKII